MTQLLYRFLDVGVPPGKADCIFVLAGMHERKPFGIDLWRRGYAPELILSVGRFEWRRFYSLGLPGDGGLRDLVHATPPQDRHFFVRFRGNLADSTLIPTRRPGTLSEGCALADYLSGDDLHTLMVVSSPFHLRRTALAFRCAFRGRKTDLFFVGVPQDFSTIREADLRKTKEMRVAVWREFRKYLYYRLVLLGVLLPFQARIRPK